MNTVTLDLNILATTALTPKLIKFLLALKEIQSDSTDYFELGLEDMDDFSEWQTCRHLKVLEKLNLIQVHRDPGHKNRVLVIQ